MYTRTTTKSSTTSNRGRGRGRGRGRQTNHNSASTHSNIYDEDVDENYTSNDRRRGSSRYPNNRENHQSTNRGRGNHRANNHGNARYDRSDIAGRSSSPDSNSSRIPKHAQNPYFVGELMSRFNNMLPTSTLLDNEVPGGTNQQEFNVASNPISNIHTLDSVRNSNPPRSSFEPKPIKTNGLYSQNGNTNTNYGDKRLKVGSNGNPEKINFKYTNGSVPKSNISIQELYFSTRDRMSENVRMNDNPNVSDTSTRDSQNKKHKHESHANVNHRKTCTSSRRSDNNSVSYNTVSLEKRKAIMQSFGFDTELLEVKSSDGSQSQATDIYKPSQSSSLGSIAQRTSPRVRYNLENEPTRNSLPRPISEHNDNDDSKLKSNHRYPQDYSGNAKSNIQNSNLLSRKSHGNPVNANKTESISQPLEISGTFFNKLDAIGRFGHVAGTVTSPQINTGAGKPKNSQEARKNTHSQSTAQNFNPFLKTERATSQNRPERSNSPYLTSQRNITNNHNPSVFDLPPGLTNKDVAGRNQFSVQRPVRDMNERVPTRAEALEHIQEQYEIQRAQFEAKKREKEAKKKQEYLARYKHVDQGYRMNDGLLDEAAGYAPGYNPIETVEDIRQRQQEQLRQDALAYQERKMEEEERKKRMEEKKAREKLEKNKNYNAGYRLGHGDNEDSAYPRQNTPRTTFKHKQTQNRNKRSEKSDKKEFRDSISPELLIEGETEEEALQRQEEQLIVEMLIQQQMEVQARNKEAFEENNSEFEDNQGQHSANSEALHQFTTKPVRQPPQMPNQGSRNVTTNQQNQSGHSSRAMAQQRLEKYARNVEKSVEQPNEQVRSIERNSRASNPLADPEHLGTKRQNISPQAEQFDNVSRNSLFQVPASSQASSGPEPLPKKAASCVLKNRNGAVLVLRPTPEQLNQALATRLEVQDEVDKYGYSTHYKPQAEQAPLYSNNRFERKPDFDTVKPPGAKNSSNPVTKPASSVVTTNNVPMSNETAKQEEPVYDHKAELRAARLRFQQKYEEDLKKKQEQNDGS